MSKRFKTLIKFMAILGPGIVVMLADTDAGSIITAAQSGTVWQYRMILLQLLLIPVLFIAQELTVRLGIVTRLGHGELIKKHFGKCWAWISVTTLLICCLGAILTELSGIAGVGELFNIPPWISILITITGLTIMVCTGSYRSVERCALGIGLFELVFIFVAVLAHPHYHEAWSQLWSIPIHSSSYLYLSAANIGAVIMPWMIFYQQSAVVDKKLTVEHLSMARWDTFFGAIITQLIMVSVIITTAATLGKTYALHSLDNVHQISEALIPFLGETTGKILFGLGMLGASLVAAIVVSLTAAWGLGEVLGYKCSLEHKPKEAPWFYLTYAFSLILGGILILSGINLVKLSVGIEVMNAMLLPLALGFLVLLAIRVLPKPYRLKGFYGFLVITILSITTIFGLVAGLYGLA